MASIQNKAVLVDFTGTVFSPTRTDKKVTKEVTDAKQARDGSCRVSKFIISETAVEPIARIVKEARAYHYAQTLPWSDKGHRILATARFQEYSDKMRALKARYEAEVETFLAKYQDYITEARSRLNAMFNLDDYPEVDAVRRRFRFKTDFLPLPSGEDFRVDLQEEEIAALRGQVDSQVRAGIVREIKPAIKAMVERLGNPEAVFRNTLVTNIKDLLKLIPDGDPEVDRLRRDMAELVRHDPDTLRQSVAARSATAAKAQAVLDDIRKILPDDGDEPPAKPAAQETNDILSKMSGFMPGPAPALLPVPEVETPPTPVPANIVPLPEPVRPVAAPRRIGAAAFLRSH